MKIQRNKAIVVDDKTRPRKWGVETLLACGYDRENIVEASYGDDAYIKYISLKNKGEKVDIILSDYHMDVRRKPPQDICSYSFKKAQIFSGTDLAKKIFEKHPKQKFCLISAGLNERALLEAKDAGIELTLFKRRPEEKKFQDYTSTINNYIDNKINLESVHELLPLRLISQIAP